MLKKYFIFFAISIIIYFTHAVITRQGLYGDGNGYYVYTQSIYFDHSLNSPKVYEYLSNFNGTKYVFSRIFWNPEVNPYTIGTGLVWMPSMFLIESLNSIFHLTVERFDLIFELGPGLTGIVLMIFGLYFLEKYLVNFYSKSVVYWTIITLFFGSGVFYYTAFEPALSHQPSFFIICLLLYWSQKFKKSIASLLTLGVIFGFLAIIRPVDSILIFPILWHVKPNFKDLLTILFGSIIGIAPQLINQYLTFGNILVNPYLNGSNGTWQFNFIHSIEYLFSPKRGLFLWTPLFLISVWGLIKNRARIQIVTLIILWLVTSSWSAYLSAGFGQRLAFSAIPYLALGLASFINKADFKKVIAVLLIFSMWNMLLIKNVYLHKNMFIQNESFSYNQFIKYMITW